MLPASNKGVGMNVGFPDPCLTPVGPALAPIPYPNMGMNVLATPFSPNIFLTMMPALNMGSLIPMTMGDEPGAPNVVFKMAGGYTVGNPKILANCLPAVNLTSPSWGNMRNNPIGAALVPSVTNVLFTFQSSDPNQVEVASLSNAVCPPVDQPALRVRRFGPAGYVRMATIASDMPSRLHGILREISSKIRAVIIDLRGCPGGDLDAAIDIASEFLPRGSEIATLIDCDGDETVYRATRSFDWQLDLIVMVDKGTASAAEVLAGALQHHGRAIIVGERTYGKGSVQRYDNGVMKTIGTCRLPGNRAIEGAGIKGNRRASREMRHGLGKEPEPVGVAQ